MGALEEGRFVEEVRLGLEAELTGSDSDSGSGSGSRTVGEIEEAVRVLLQGVGEDPDREGIKRTPFRVAKAFREGTAGYKQKAKDIVQGALFRECGFENGAGCASGNGGLVVVRDIDLFSYCESCLLPFHVQCHVGYVPSGQRVLGLSKFAKVAAVFAKRLQDPQRLANQICSSLHDNIKPAGVAVALQCWHIQFPEALRCNPNPRHPSKSGMQGWVRASVCSSSGVFEDEQSSFGDDFLSLLRFRGINMDLGSPIQSWCPSKSLQPPQCNGHISPNLSNGRISPKSGVTQSAMISAVSSILQLLGEDPLRKELVGTPYRYVQWLMNFKTSNLDPKHGLRLGLHKRTGTDVGIGREEICSELNLPFCAQCEHHLLPFHGVVHIGYFGEDGEAIERSFLQSVVHFYGCKLQLQERLTRQIAEAIYSVFHRGVMVVVEAGHICMISRGIEKVGSNTATIALLGQFSTDPKAKASFLHTISKSTASGGVVL